MRIAITGASGFIGTALQASLAADDVEVITLVRRPARGDRELQWDPDAGSIDATRLRGVDAVVHLAGAGVGDHRWNPAYKRLILESRIRGTATIARAVAEAGVPTLISASAIGYYGDTGERVTDESGRQGMAFLAEVVAAWEAAARPASEAGVRVVFVRTGLVAAKQGGAFARMLPLFRLGVGGPLGTGRQYWSSITMRDHLRGMRFLLDHPVSGAFNFTSPTPVTNAEFTRALGRALHRPTLIPVPALALRLVVGEFAGEILASQRIVPTRLLEAGFRFQDATLEAITSSLL